MFNFKSKKVFEKINKMNRKQAYTIGAIVVVLVVALILLASAMGEEDDSFAGMEARGYDLAQMPFATDEAEKYLLANSYPDMQENGSSLLYSLQEKEARQELELTQFDEDDDDDEEENEDSDYRISSSDDDYSGYGSDSSRGYGGRGGGYGGSGGGKTEIGTLSSSGMASAGGSGINSTYGPTGDFRQFKGREDKGKEKPIQLKTDDARRSLAQFKSGSLASARMNENKMKNAGKALFGGNIQGSDAFKKDGTVDLDKLKEGGFTLDTSAPSHTTDLNNLDKKVADAAKNAQDKKNDNKKPEPGFWEKLFQQAMEKMVNLAVDSAGDWVKGWIAGKQAYGEALRSESDSMYATVKTYTDQDKASAWASFNDPEHGTNKYGITQQDFDKYYDAAQEGKSDKWVANNVSKNVTVVNGFANAAKQGARQGAVDASRTQRAIDAARKDNETRVGEQNERYQQCIKNCKGKDGDAYDSCLQNCK